MDRFRNQLQSSWSSRWSLTTLICITRQTFSCYLALVLLQVSIILTPALQTPNQTVDLVVRMCLLSINKALLSIVVIVQINKKLILYEKEIKSKRTSPSTISITSWAAKISVKPSTTDIRVCRSGVCASQIPRFISLCSRGIRSSHWSTTFSTFPRFSLFSLLWIPHMIWWRVSGMTDGHVDAQEIVSDYRLPSWSPGIICMSFDLSHDIESSKVSRIPRSRESGTIRVSDDESYGQKGHAYTSLQYD